MPPRTKKATDIDRCGGCDRTLPTNPPSEKVICWGNLPHVQIDEMGNQVQLRECEVDKDDPACFAFRPKGH